VSLQCLMTWQVVLQVKHTEPTLINDVPLKYSENICNDILLGVRFFTSCSPVLDFITEKYLQHSENLHACKTFLWRQFSCFTSPSQKNLLITHRQTYRYPFLRKTHLKTTVEDIGKNLNPFKKVPGTFCYPTFTYIIEKGLHRISYIQHPVSAKPVVGLQISTPITFGQLPLIPLILGSAMGMAPFCASSNNDKKSQDPFLLICYRDLQ